MLAKGIYYITHLEYGNFHGSFCAIIRGHKVLNVKNPNQRKTIKFAFPQSGNRINLKEGEYIQITPGEYIPISGSTYFYKKINGNVISKKGVSQQSSIINKRNSSNERHFSDIRLAFESSITKIPIQSNPSFGKRYLSVTKEVEIEWNKVVFNEGRAWITNPFGIDSILYEEIGLKESFNRVKKHFNNSFPKIKLGLSQSNNILKVINPEVFKQLIIFLKNSHQKLNLPKISPKIVIEPNHQASKVKDLEAFNLRERILEKDSVYLNYLCSRQDKTYPIYCGYENIVSQQIQNYEEVYIFTIRTSSGMNIYIYENSSASRSSVLFISEKEESLKAINQIHTYFNSNEGRKRKLIQLNQVDFESPIHTYRRIVHSSFEQWKRDLEFYLKIY